MAAVLENWGTILLSGAIEPAIKLAVDGFNINRVLSEDNASFRTTLQAETAAIFEPGSYDNVQLT
jgi:gamma-glutamyltranspeptidase